MTRGNKSKREMILDAAFTLFIEKGYLDAKIIDIADAAGIGKGTVYEYFESKDAIFLELFRTRVAAGFECLSELLSKEIFCVQKIREYLNIELANISQYTFSKNFFTDLVLKSDAFRNPDLIEGIRLLIRKNFTILRDIVEEGIRKGEFRDTEPALAAVYLLGAINLYVSIDFSPDGLNEFLPAKKVEEYREDFFGLLLNGLKS